MKSIERDKAVKMRQDGLPITVIAKTLGVSKSSVSLWVRNVVLTVKQIEALKQMNPAYNAQLNGGKARKDQATARRRVYQEEGKAIAKMDNPLHMAGCMLYWAEGAKHRTACDFSNSDLNMLKFYLRFLFEACNITKNQIRVHVNCYTCNGLTVNDIETYWSERLSLPRTCFIKTTADNMSKYSKQKRSKNKLLYGTVSLRVNSVQLVQQIFGAIQEYAGFHNDFILM